MIAWTLLSVNAAMMLSKEIKRVKAIDLLPKLLFEVAHTFQLILAMLVDDLRSLWKISTGKSEKLAGSVVVVQRLEADLGADVNVSERNSNSCSRYSTFPNIRQVPWPPEQGK